jgi:hypothetical protein
MAQRPRTGIAATGHQRGMLTGISAFQLAGMDTAESRCRDSAPARASLRRVTALGFADGQGGDRCRSSEREPVVCEIGQGGLAVAGASGPLQQPLAAVETSGKAGDVAAIDPGGP